MSDKRYNVKIYFAGKNVDFPIGENSNIIKHIKDQSFFVNDHMIYDDDCILLIRGQSVDFVKANVIKEE